MDKNIKRVNKFIFEISKGNIKSLDKLFVEFGGLLYVMARKYLFDKNYAEDLVSDVLLKLVKNAGQFRPEENGLNWLFKSIKNAAININIRNNHFHMENIEEHFDICDVFKEEKLIDSILIRNALEELAPLEKRIIEMKFWENLTVREIAQKIDEPLSTTQRLISSIYEKLKKECELKEQKNSVTECKKEQK